MKTNCRPDACLSFLATRSGVLARLRLSQPGSPMTIRSILQLGLVLGMMLAGTRLLCGQPPATPQASAFTVESVSGEVFSAERLLADDRTLSIDPDGTQKQLPWDQVLSISRSAPAVAPQPAGDGFLALVTGGRLPATIRAIDAEGVQIETGTLQQTVPLDAVAAIVWKDSARLEQMLAEPVDDVDRFLVTGNAGAVTVEGMFESLSGEKLGLQYQGKSQTLSREKVEAFLPARIRAAVPSDSRVTLEMAGGQTVRGAAVRLENDQVLLQVPGGLIRIDWSAIQSVRFASDRLQKLSDLEPVSYSRTILFAPDRGWQRNRSLEGNPLRLLTGSGEQEFRNGLAQQATSQLVFANDGGFDRFLAVVGIDRETAGRGDCVVRIRGDGIELWSERIRGGEPARAVDVDISGMQQIELSVDAGEQFDLADHVSWAEARFLRTR